MAGLEMGLQYRICGSLTYAVHPLAAARATLDASRQFSNPKSSGMGQREDRVI